MTNKEMKSQRRQSRQDRLEHEQVAGKARAMSWGGKPSAKQERNQFKRSIQSFA